MQAAFCQGKPADRPDRPDSARQRHCRPLGLISRLAAVSRSSRLGNATIWPSPLAALAASLPLASQAAGAAHPRPHPRQPACSGSATAPTPSPIPTGTSSGQPAGYIVDLCLEVAAALRAGNVRTEYVLVPADQRFEAVRDGRVDILCDPSSVTMPRREMVDFSLPTFLDGAGVLSRTSKPVQRFEDLARQAGRRARGTTTEQTLRESLGELSLKADHRSGARSPRRHRPAVGRQDRRLFRRPRASSPPCSARAAGPGFAAQQAIFQLRDLCAGAAARRRRVPAAGRPDAGAALSQRQDQRILAKTFGKAPPDEMLKAMILINSLPDQ